MIGLLYILLLWLYYVVAKAVVKATINFANRREKNPTLWGGIAIFIMFNILFWDLIPVYAVHSYKCSTEGGFKIYKTIDEWKLENPSVAETLNPDPYVSQQAYSEEYKNSKRLFRLPNGTELAAFYDDNGKKYRYTSMTRNDGTRAYWLNQRFVEEIVSSHVWYIVQKRAERIIDTQTGEIQAEEIEFNTSLKNPIVSPAKHWSNYKIWLGIKSCELYGSKKKWLINGASFNELTTKYYHFNGEEK